MMRLSLRSISRLRILRARHILGAAVQRTIARDQMAAERLVLGEGSYASRPTILAFEGDPDHQVVVGAYSSIADGVTFFVGGNHPLEWVSTFPFRAKFGLPGAFGDGHPRSRGPIIVGSDVWIGHGAVLLSGVTIGHGAVVGAQAVVTRDVAPYMIVAGNPAREIRQRFSDTVVTQLLEVAWWTWPRSELVSIVDLLNGGTVEDLLAYAVRR